jgi:hypothetical protein
MPGASPAHPTPDAKAITNAQSGDNRGIGLSCSIADPAMPARVHSVGVDPTFGE